MAKTVFCVTHNINPNQNHFHFKKQLSPQENVLYCQHHIIYKAGALNSKEMNTERDRKSYIAHVVNLHTILISYNKMPILDLTLTRGLTFLTLILVINYFILLIPSSIFCLLFFFLYFSFLPCSWYRTKCNRILCPLKSI